MFLTRVRLAVSCRVGLITLRTRAMERNFLFWDSIYQKQIYYDRDEFNFPILLEIFHFGDTARTEDYFFLAKNVNRQYFRCAIGKDFQVINPYERESQPNSVGVSCGPKLWESDTMNYVTVIIIYFKGFSWPKMCSHLTSGNLDRKYIKTNVTFPPSNLGTWLMLWRSTY